MNQVTDFAAKPNRQSSLLAIMAERYHMDPTTFANTVRKTAMPSNATNEEFAAFMMVAKEYNLNPILKEIHAFPKKGGGIQPVVSIDGWVSLINQQKDLDGYSFEWTHDDKGELVSCKCIMHRKDRKYPVVVEEFLVECYRPTDPWKMKHRMLRHKALIQAARYAFGFAGVMDEDEAAKIAAMRDITPERRPQMADFVTTGNRAETLRAEEKEREAEQEVVDEQTEPAHDAQTGEMIEDAPEPSPADAYDLGNEARVANKPRRVPVEVEAAGTSFAEAWFSGWDAADEELAASRKKK
jgi:phage recombination protein Bet